MSSAFDPRTMCKRRRPAGFTLIEVIVALAVLAIALSAVIKSASENVANAGYLRDRTLANWVATNRITEIRVQGLWPDTGLSNGDTEMAGRVWDWEQKVEKTSDDDLRRIEISVGYAGEDSVISSLVAFVARKPKQ